MKIRLVIALMASAAIKLAAMAEWPQLYRAFLFIPANLLGLFRGSVYAESDGIYAFPDFILDYSCSGIHFFIIALLLASLTPNPSPKGEGPHKLPLLLQEKGVGGLRQLAQAYVLTLVANTFRVGLFLKLMPLSVGRPWLHEAVGTAVFLSFLITYYFLIQPKTCQAAAQPDMSLANKNLG